MPLPMLAVSCSAKRPLWESQVRRLRAPVLHQLGQALVLSIGCPQACSLPMSGLCKHILAVGAIFGLGGALAVYCARHRDLMGSTSDAILRQLGQALALNIAIGFTTPQIDQW